MSHSIAPAQLLTAYLPVLQALDLSSGILDLACGHGRNGLWLAQQQLPVTFADRNRAALTAVQEQLDAAGLEATCWEVDFEQPGAHVLRDKRFDAIVVFNYLHRPLFPDIRQAVRPGGVIIYETFTVAQRQFGRPANPDFLLQPGELPDYFNEWEVLHNYAGELTNPQRAVAQLVARKPEPDLSRR